MYRYLISTVLVLFLFHFTEIFTLSNNIHSKTFSSIFSAIACKEDIWIGKASKSKYNVVASSFLQPSGKYNYNPENLFDKLYKTCWCPNNLNQNNGINEFVIFKIPYGIKGIKISNGVALNQELFYENNRIKKLYLGLIVNRLIENGKFVESSLCPVNIKNTLYFHTTDDYIILKDTFNYQNILFSEIKGFSWNIETIKKSKTIYLVIGIIDIYKGNKYNDTCISEIEFIQ